MSDVDLSSYKSLYIQTAKEYLEAFGKNVALLLQQPNSIEAIEQMYISSHSLKSQSMVMNYTQTSTLAGTLEKVLKAAKVGLLTLTPELLVSIQQAGDKLRQSIASIEKEGKESELQETITQLENISGVRFTVS